VIARHAIGRRRRLAALPGIVTIEEAGGGFVAWGTHLASLEPELSGDPATLAGRIAENAPALLAIEVSERDVPTPERLAALARFADELQLRGTSVPLHGTLAGLLTAARMDDLDARFAAFDDLASCVRTLRAHDAMRRRCVSRRGSGTRQLRMPARAACLAPLCGFVRESLERGGVDAPTVLAMLREAYVAMVDVLRESWRTDDADLAAAVTVHDGTAAITILDRGQPRAGEVIEPREGAPVDRIHRFRIPDRHNALVLEKRLGARPQSR